MQHRITVDGNVTERVADAFPHLETRHDGRYYVVTGDVVDQAQLHGVLALVRDLNVPLIDLTRLDTRSTAPRAGSKPPTRVAHSCRPGFG